MQSFVRCDNFSKGTLMRVLHVLDELKPSGAEAMLQSAASYWKGRGVECDILCTGAKVGAYASTLEKAGYSIHHIPFLPSYEFARDVFRLMKSKRYDAVHIHPERGNFWYALAAYVAGGGRIIRTVHNVFPFSSFLRFERYFQRSFMRRILGVEMVSISRSVEKVEWEKFFNRSTLIPNWFDSNKLKPATAEERILARKKLDISEDTVVFTSIGGCWSYKNHSSIIEAATTLPKDLAFVYLHVGQESDGNPERKMANGWGISSRCRFLGIVPDILPILHASDVYVMPSVFEGFGVAAVEAMGAGLPAILSDVPGLRDFRELTDDVYWVAPTPESIARAMMRFVAMPYSQRRDTGLKLSASVHKHFSIEKGASAYAELYGSVRRHENFPQSTAKTRSHA
jgi:glycosyltransferase involved in cell wall biosynthesis